MTDRERLIEILEDTLHEWECDVQPETLSQIAEHLLENGVIVPPCKVGDTVWAIAITGKIYKYMVNGFHYFEDKHFMFGAYRIREDGKKVNPTWQDSEIGKTVFLSLKEAEKALAERRLNNGHETST